MNQRAVGRAHQEGELHLVKRHQRCQDGGLPPIQTPAAADVRIEIAVRRRDRGRPEPLPFSRPRRKGRHADRHWCRAGRRDLLRSGVAPERAPNGDETGPRTDRESGTLPKGPSAGTQASSQPFPIAAMTPASPGSYATSSVNRARRGDVLEEPPQRRGLRRIHDPSCGRLVQISRRCASPSVSHGGGFEALFERTEGCYQASTGRACLVDDPKLSPSELRREDERGADGHDAMIFTASRSGAPARSTRSRRRRSHPVPADPRIGHAPQHAGNTVQGLRGPKTGSWSEAPCGGSARAGAHVLDPNRARSA